MSHLAISYRLYGHFSQTRQVLAYARRLFPEATFRKARQGEGHSTLKSCTAPPRLARTAGEGLGWVLRSSRGARLGRQRRLALAEGHEKGSVPERHG
jgi:hypothetical protein